MFLERRILVHWFLRWLFSLALKSTFLKSSNLCCLVSSAEFHHSLSLLLWSDKRLRCILYYCVWQTFFFPMASKSLLSQNLSLSSSWLWPTSSKIIQLFEAKLLEKLPLTQPHIHILPLLRIELQFVASWRPMRIRAEIKWIRRCTSHSISAQSISLYPIQPTTSLKSSCTKFYSQ